MIRSPAITGTGDGSFRRPPLPEFRLALGPVLSPIRPLCCHAGRAWHGGAAAEVLWRSGAAGLQRGIHTEEGIVGKVRLDMSLPSSI